MAEANRRPATRRERPSGERCDRARAWLGTSPRCRKRDGAWRGDYGGPMFLLPMYVAACHIARPADPRARRRAGMIALPPERAAPRRQHRPARRGLGLPVHHRARLRGAAPARGGARRRATRRELRALDPRPRHGRSARASWGKFMLALLNLYDYDGLHPVLPELWLLARGCPDPSQPPLVPRAGRSTCPWPSSTATSAQAPPTSSRSALRGELYDRPTTASASREHRNTIAPATSTPRPRGCSSWPTG